MKRNNLCSASASGLLVIVSVVVLTACGEESVPAAIGDWHGTVSLRADNGDEVVFETTMIARQDDSCGTRKEPVVRVTNVCPVGGGSFIVDPSRSGWSGELPCTPMALFGCDDTTLTLASFTFAVNDDSMSATGNGRLSGCGRETPVVLTYFTERVPTDPRWTACAR